MGLFGSLFGPQRGSRDFNCARVHRGAYLIGTNQYTRYVEHDFRIIHGEAEIRTGRPVRVQYGLEEETCRPTDLETFYIFPTSEYVRLWIEDSHKGRSIFLWREEDRTKSRMFKQRIANPILRFTAR